MSAQSPPPIRSVVYAPHPRLAPYVSAYLTTAIDVAVDQSTIDLFPVGHAVLSCAFDDQPLTLDGTRAVTAKLNLTGQLTRYHQLTVRGQYSYAYALFRPFGAWQVLGVPQAGLTDDFADLRALVPGAATETAYARLRARPQADADAVAALDEWLLTLLGRPPLRDTSAVRAAVEWLEARAGAATSAELTAVAGLSAPRLVRAFKQQVGLPPKQYARVVRFIAAYRTLREAAPHHPDWAALVERYAYFDQAHFIKEFRGFFGYTPSQVHRSLLNIADHVV
jgi:AraC-like DNA-binding protein